MMMMTMVMMMLMKMMAMMVMMMMMMIMLMMMMMMMVMYCLPFGIGTACTVVHGQLHGQLTVQSQCDIILNCWAPGSQKVHAPLGVSPPTTSRWPSIGRVGKRPWIAPPKHSVY